MKKLFSLLLLVALTFPNYYGLSRIDLVRTWTISGSPGNDYTLLGALAANDSNQKIISITTDPPMYSFTKDGIVWVNYSGQFNGTTTFTANAIIDLDYDTNLTTDGPLPVGGLNTTNLTAYNNDIMLQAEQLSQQNSSLSTIRNLVNFVHNYLTYDISYWGNTESAESVYAGKRGVCVEYTHLLISMARSLGFDTRYVSGYVYADNWQPHAWADIYVPGYGWLPADATFGQVGILDDTHVAIHRGDDQSSTFDSLTTFDPNATIQAGYQLETSFSSADDKGVAVSISTDNTTYFTDTLVNNSRQQYVFGSFVFAMPQGYGPSSSEVMLLKPGQESHVYVDVNSSMLQSGYDYAIPMVASFDDSNDSTTMYVNQAPPTPKTPPPCPSSFIMLMLVFVSVGHRFKVK